MVTCNVYSLQSCRLQLVCIQNVCGETCSTTAIVAVEINHQQNPSTNSTNRTAQPPYVHRRRTVVIYDGVSLQCKTVVIRQTKEIPPKSYACRLSANFRVKTGRKSAQGRLLLGRLRDAVLLAVPDNPSWTNEEATPGHMRRMRDALRLRQALAFFLFSRQ